MELDPSRTCGSLLRSFMPLFWFPLSLADLFQKALHLQEIRKEPHAACPICQEFETVAEFNEEHSNILVQSRTSTQGAMQTITMRQVTDTLAFSLKEGACL